MAKVIDAIISLKDNFTPTMDKTVNSMTKMSKQAIRMGKNIEKTGKNLKKFGDNMTKHITMPIVGMGTAAAVTVAKFDDEMSKVRAISGATADEMNRLRNQAKEMGMMTRYSASQAAEAQSNLASAGFEVKEIIDALPATLSLASAGGVELAQATEIAATTLRGFGLDATQTGHVADVLASAASRTNAQIGDLGEALSYVAPVSKAMGVSLEDTTAVIGMLSNAGIKGSMAGTTLRSALTSLVNPSKDARDIIKHLGIQIFDQQGKMLPMPKLIENFQKATQGLTDKQKNAAMSVIFGERALSGMLALVDAGPAQLAELSKGFTDAAGAAQEMADIREDNLAGSWRSLKSALEAAGIAFGETLAPMLREAATRITELVRKFASLDEGTKKNIVKFALMAAAAGPIIGVIGNVTRGVGRAVTTFGNLGKGIGRAGGLMKFLLSPANLVVLAIVAIAAAAFLIVKYWEPIKGFFKSLGAGIVSVFQGIWNGVKGFINFMIDGVNMLIGGLNKLKVDIPDWVPKVGGKAFGINIPLIPKLATGTMNWVGGPAMVHDKGAEVIDLPRGSRVYPHDESLQIARSQGRKEGSININIAKLADEVIIREDADIDRVATALANKLNRVAFNMG